MSVYSMTGYASAQTKPSSRADGEQSQIVANDRLGVEIRSVNSRFLDLAFRLPDELRFLEPALREKLTAKFKRGKIELRAAVESNNAGLPGEPSTRLLQRLNAIQDNVKAWLPNAAPLTVAEVIRLGGDQSVSGSQWQKPLLSVTDQAIKALLAAREREGARLAEMLHERIGQLRALAQQAAPLIPQLVEQQRQRFLERWREAMGLTENSVGNVGGAAAQDRALTEATAFAIRIDVAEELTRLGAHLDEIERLLQHGGDIGKRLDFLIQELHREANTLGAKSAALELTHISVDMKVLIEQMREQVQNLE